jgi:hypothetical protein
MDSFPSNLLDELARVYASAAIDAYFVAIEATIRDQHADGQRVQDTERLTLSASDESL